MKIILLKRYTHYMTGKISRCNICGEFVQSKRQLKEHKDKNHRITNSKMIIAGE